MWFKNLRAYRLSSAFALDAEQLETALSEREFSPCGKSQPLAFGWVPPLGEQTNALVHAVSGRFLLCLKREERLLPSTVVRELLEEKVATIELEESRKVYRRERLTLKDEIIQDCLPRAFTRSSKVYAYIDVAKNWVFVDASSANKAEELLNLLRECVGSFPVLLPQVQNAPIATMTQWLASQSEPDDFTLGEECELRELGEDGGIVRCRGVDLFSEELEAHLNAGKQVAKIAVQWQDRISLVLSEDLCLRRLKFSEALLEAADDNPDADEAARMDADFVLMSEALGELQDAVMNLFGGEAES